MPISVIMAAALAAVVFPRRMAVGNSDVMVSGKWDNETLFWTPEFIAGADLPGVLDPDGGPAGPQSTTTLFRFTISHPMRPPTASVASGCSSWATAISETFTSA